MNIEEEREAFEENGFPSPLIQVCLTFTEGAYVPLREKQSIHSQKLADHCNKLFPVWLAAKAHAAEMAKDAVRVKKRPFKLHGWGVYVGGTYHMRLAIGATKEDATQWAKDNGYRVIEE